MSAWPDKLEKRKETSLFSFWLTKIMQTPLPAKRRTVWEKCLKAEDTGQHPPTQTSIYIAEPFTDEQLNFWQEVTHKWFKFLWTLRERKWQCWQPHRVVNRHLALFIKSHTYTDWVQESKNIKLALNCFCTTLSNLAWHQAIQKLLKE